MKRAMLALVIGLTSTTLSNSACVECTLVGCLSGLSVQIAVPEDPGEYTLDIDGDDTFSCVFTVDDEGELVHGESDTCFLGDYGFIRVDVEKGDYELVLTDGDGDEVYDAEVTESDWESYRPNGPRCEPVCDGTTVTLGPRTAG